MQLAPSTSTAAISQDSTTASAASFARAQTDPEDTIFVAAQRGDVVAIRALLDSGRARATDHDSENVTPLHWAAINGHVDVCQLLLEEGAEVDAPGGNLMATPMQWAARYGHLYVIRLLVAHGADPTFLDSQGYNALHLVTHSSFTMPLLYMLHQRVNIDSRDEQGHTALMWAVYQDDIKSVNMLLLHGASLTTEDDDGMTPLHWAAVRGHPVSIRRLIENGASVNAKDNVGRTPRDIADELENLDVWKRALEEGGRDDEGVKKRRPLSERSTRLVTFTLPTLVFYLIYMTFAIFPWYTSIMLAIAGLFGMDYIVDHVLLKKSSETDSIIAHFSAFVLPILVFWFIFMTLTTVFPWYVSTLLALAGWFGMSYILNRVLPKDPNDSAYETPYGPGTICGSMVWIVYGWATRLIHQTESHVLLHLLFGLCVGICAYSFFRVVTLDPGTCPKPTSNGELKSIVEDLASKGRLNDQTFCIQCMVRNHPIRHAGLCGQGIAVGAASALPGTTAITRPFWNCVGMNNHRQFVICMSTFVLGVGLFDYLTYTFFSSIALHVPDAPSSCPLPSPLCVITAHDAFLVSVATLATFNLFSASIVLAYQLWRIARQMTNLEVSTYGFLGGRGEGYVQASPDALDTEQVGRARNGGFLTNSLTLDRFMRGSNPFDLGVYRNCLDFWTTGQEFGVEYQQLYEVPPEGFRERRRMDSSV
ncbi:Palmitoyltransferase [Mycena venus]|uniref:protein S-acyltransferase n=1 Tax=Mycena venus TaxID=2733690 RepID=A0A8H7CMH3_9AGAR|nr:Palmitoyltransferase [Mycena venus]